MLQINPPGNFMFNPVGPIKMIDAQARARVFPFNKPCPSIEQLEQVKLGDFVKIGLEGFHPVYSAANRPEDHQGGEQFGLQVIGTGGSGYIGVLQNELKNYILRKGIVVSFEQRNILDILTLEDYERLP